MKRTYEPEVWELDDKIYDEYLNDEEAQRKGISYEQWCVNHSIWDKEPERTGA